MPRAYRQLDLDERRTIFRLLNAKGQVAAVACHLGSTGQLRWNTLTV